MEKRKQDQDNEALTGQQQGDDLAHRENAAEAEQLLGDTPNRGEQKDQQAQDPTNK